ncbi:cell surface glycoprotein MUC18-like isoform X1, partial [Lates japonicus]
MCFDVGPKKGLDFKQVHPRKQAWTEKLLFWALPRNPVLSGSTANPTDMAWCAPSGTAAGGVFWLLLLLLALIYFLNKKSKLPCSKKDKKEVASGEVNNDIVVEMKTDKANEEAGLLNKRPSTEQ